MAGRVKELIAKYGKVGLAVHLSVSAVSYGVCYAAIKRKVDVNGLLQSVGLLPSPRSDASEIAQLPDKTLSEEIELATEKIEKKIDSAAAKVMNEGGAFAMAYLCNKALLPARIPLTIAITPPVARMWAQRRFFR